MFCRPRIHPERRLENRAHALSHALSHALIRALSRAHALRRVAKTLTLALTDRTTARLACLRMKRQAGSPSSLTGRMPILLSFKTAHAGDDFDRCVRIPPATI